jgi:hypothetical protein
MGDQQEAMAFTDTIIAMEADRAGELEPFLGDLRVVT